MTKKKATKRSRSTAAPGQYLGFSLQATRFLVRLLQGAGNTICLEVFDDVGVEKPDGTRVAEQSKSNLTTNPLADRSVDFWKTVRNWVDAAANGTLPPATTVFCLFVSDPTPGAIATLFRDASSAKTATAALDQARRLLKWKPGEQCDVAEALRPHLDVIFVADATLVAAVIARLEILPGSGGDPLDDLRPLLLQKLVSPDFFEEAVRWAHGWVKERIDRLIGQRQPARVGQQEFHDALLNYVRAHDRLDMLRSVAGSPTDAEVKSELTLRVYVRQAEIIQLGDTHVLAAVNDFLMASNDRTAWADEGYISKAHLDRFEADLSKTWRHKKDFLFVAHSQRTPIDRGQLLYHECMQHAAKVDGLETPSHFTRGSLHALADDRTIGWHPDYPSELDRQSAAQTPS